MAKEKLINWTLAENNMQRGFGAFVIFIYALYGAYIATVYILADDKGGLRSADFLLFVIVFLLLGLSNLGKLLITRTIKNGSKSLILIFIMYLLIKLIFEDSETQEHFFMLLYTDIGQNFIAGFIAFSVLNSKLPVISRVTSRSQNIEGIRNMAIISTLIFIAIILYFLTQFMDTSLFNIFPIRYLPNVYYQDFGDHITIAYCCLVSLQINYFKHNFYSTKSFVVFTLVISLQAILVFICSQVITSNKLVLASLIVSGWAIYLCKPKDLFIGRGRIKVNTFFVVPLYLFLIWLLLYQFFPALDISQLRVYDYGESSSIVENSSFQVRWNQARHIGVEQVMSAPVFGDLANRYLHTSLLSVQVMFGFIGSLLFWMFIVIQLCRIFRHGRNEDLKVIALSILPVSIVSSGFSWGPLWFLIGAMYEYTSQSPKTLNHLHNQSLRNKPQIIC